MMIEAVVVLRDRGCSGADGAYNSIAGWMEAVVVVMMEAVVVVMMEAVVVVMMEAVVVLGEAVVREEW